MADSVGPFHSIEPTEILYYFEEPLIFFTEATPFPLLCLKINGDIRRLQFLAVAASRRTVRRLLDGTLSLRSAFLQSWCWVIHSDEKFVVSKSDGVPREEVPEEYLPEVGIGLYPEHGYIVDELSGLSEQGGFMTVSFKGGQLGSGLMPFGVVKGLFDGVYTSVRKIFGPVIASSSREKLGEGTIGKLLSIPVHQPVFASLSITIDAPYIDFSSVKRNIAINTESTVDRFNDAADSFLNSAQEIERLAADDTLLTTFAYHASVALEVVAQIAPHESTPFDSMSISRKRRSTASSRVTFDTVRGQRVVDAYNQVGLTQHTIGGRIVELNLRSGTFVLGADRNSNSKSEITCIVGDKNLRQTMIAFTTGSQITVSGQLVSRVRRDLMYIDSITLPDGTVIKAT